MELNPDGRVKAFSVRAVKRVVFKRNENQPLHYRSAIIRCRNIIRLGEIAVIDGQGWVKVNPADFHGAGWIEVV